MRQLSRLAAPLAALPLLLASTACSNEKAEPPPPGAKLCGVTMASWWYDATGANDLSGKLTGDGLPLTNPDQSEYSTHTAVCSVSSGGKRVGSFRAEVATADKVMNAAGQIAERPAKNRFAVAGGTGMVDENLNDDGAEAWWTCKSALLNVSLQRPKDVKKRAELAKALGKRVAGVVGCPGPVPARASG
ncbi:hypothetical protein [Streptomyces sp. NPDC058371]|uniref:hypothetical protein n=1 Tax=Streptomyces sp. NPDC058371 TaxID=3346463 RepID=UPI003654A20C